MDLSVASCCVTTNVIYVRYKVSLGLSRRLRANFRLPSMVHPLVLLSSCFRR